MEALPTLSAVQYELVYNMLSLAIAAMFASFAFFVMARQQLTSKYRPAMIMSALVVGIAGYHYWRIFNSWGDAYVLSEAGTYVASGQPFNDAYRYVDWLLTVPLLAAELVSVLALAAVVRKPLMTKLVIAAVLMIATGYPGELATDATTRAVWGTISTIPFCYIVYALWVELSKATTDASPRVREMLGNTRLLLIATWGFYPITYMFPMFGIAGSNVEVGLQVGYSIADILAKCGYGFMIYGIARAKMEAEGVTASDAVSSFVAAK